jgi:hypothetical protein
VGQVLVRHLVEVAGPASPTAFVDEEVAQDAIHPAAKACAGGEAVARSQGVDNRALDKVIGIGTTPSHAQGMPSQCGQQGEKLIVERIPFVAMRHRNQTPLSPGGCSQSDPMQIGRSAITNSSAASGLGGEPHLCS